MNHCSSDRRDNFVPQWSKLFHGLAVINIHWFNHIYQYTSRIEVLASRIITGFNYDIDVHADCISHELLNLMQTDFQEIICLKSIISAFQELNAQFLLDRQKLVQRLQLFKLILEVKLDIHLIKLLCLRQFHQFNYIKSQKLCFLEIRRFNYVLLIGKCVSVQSSKKKQKLLRSAKIYKLSIYPPFSLFLFEGKKWHLKNFQLKE